MKQILRCALLIAIAVIGNIASAAEPTKPVDFNREVRPILADHCFACHGPAEAGRKADLRLDLREAAIEFGAITPGETDESELVKRILSHDEDEIMPPHESKKPLSDAQKSTLVRWVEQGAPYAKHWSFESPQKPLPPTNDEKWGHNPIDRFVFEKLHSAGLHPMPEADRAALIRRVSFDLTGLPPTLEELNRFEGEQRENWYEQMVDYYLARPAYGERMALAWLDAARYGDTSVFHADGPRDMWPWRDWVIESYNANKPFNDFTIEQIAGDLLPNATAQQKIASGFNRNHATTDEGGAIAEEWRVDYVVDRVQTTSNVWLGISMECSQCHSHKFDPISQKEYYGFFAFFNQTTDPGMQSRKGNQSPVVNVPNPLQDAEVKLWADRIAEVEAKLKNRSAEIDDPFNQWLVEASKNAQSDEAPPAAAGLVQHFALDEIEGSDAVGLEGVKGIINGKPLWVEGKNGGGLQIDGSNFVDLGQLGDFDRTDSVSYGCWVKPSNLNGVPLGKMNEGQAHRGWDIYISGGAVSVHIINSWPTNAIKVTTNAKIPNNKWTHLFATYDGSGKAAGVKIYINGKSEPWKIEQDSLTATTKTKVPLKIGRRNNSSQLKGIVDDVKFFDRALTDNEVASLAGSDPIAAILALPTDERTPEQLASLRDHYLRAIDKQYQTLLKEKAKASAQAAAIKKASATCMIMQEQPKPRPTYLLMRGNYASPDKSEVISPNVPAVFPPLPESAPKNRLGLAQWLVSDEHPLTSRVTVNRYWTMLFGHGIVATPMDFGSQGALPSHPELLDWLAVDFREHGWNVKRTLKQMLMSATYRQSSRTTREVFAADPMNQWYSRGPRSRLQGEMIRDTALACSDLLNTKIGGAGTKPYQPAGLWNEVALTGNVRFVQDKGDKLYRKSMYIYWKRSAPHPGMQIFDAPTREKCVVQRDVTNTPLQALYTLNDVQFVEASRMFAQRTIKSSDSVRERIAYAWRTATSRTANDRVLATLESLFASELQKFQDQKPAAKALIGVGESPVDESIDPAELAAWTIIASTILNADAAITK